MQFQQIIFLLTTYKYLILFPIVFAEGPIVTVVAGFLVSLGQMDFLISYVIIVFADLLGDSAYYILGRWGGKFISRWGRYIGVKEEQMFRLENHFKERGGATLLLGKISHGIGGAFLAAAGLAKMPYSKFLWFNFIATIIKSLGLLLVGFYFGDALLKINSYFGFATAISIGLVLIAAFFIFWKKKIWKKKL